MYADADELARILQIPSPTTAQQAAFNRVLEAAAIEIDHYLARTTPLVEPYPDLVVEVNLERAAELWKAEQSPYGIVVLGGESHYTARNSFARYAFALLPLKERWGIA